MPQVLDYYIRYIEEIFTASQFQIWIQREYSTEPILIYGERSLSQEPPVETKETTKTSTHFLFEKEDHTEIECHYTYGTILWIKLFDLKSEPEEKTLNFLYDLLQTIDLNETIKLRNKEMKNILSSTSTITSSLDTTEVIESIIQNILQVLPSSDAGYLMLYNEETKMLMPRVSVGFRDGFYKFQTMVGESITGNVFKDGKMQMYNSQDEMIQAMRKYNVNEDNYNTILSASINPYNGLICVPIEIQNERLGVLSILKSRVTKPFSTHTIKLLQGFASQTGVAIQNSRLHAEAKQRLEKITQLNNELEQRYTIHNRLTKIAMENKGTAHLIDTISYIMKRPLMFYNRMTNSILTTHNHIDENCVDINKIGEYFSHKKSPTTINKQHDDANLYLFPIFNQNIFLGCLIIPHDQGLFNIDHLTLEQSSPILALELIKTQTLTNIQYREAHEKFFSLIKSDNPLSSAEALNINPDDYYFVALFEFPKNEIDFQHIDMEIYQWITKIKNTFPYFDKIVYGQDYQITLVLSAKEEKKLIHAYDTLYALYKKTKPLFKGGVSNIVKGVHLLKKAYGDANKVIDYLDARNKTTLLQYEEMGLNRLFINQPSYEIDKFIAETYSVFAEEDGKYEYLELTLMTYMKLNRAATKTADELNIHINTLYQRLSKIEKLLGIDLDNSEDVLNIQLASYLKSTSSF